MMKRFSRDNQVVSFLQKTKLRFSSKAAPTKMDLENLFMSCIELLGATYPNQSLLEYYLQPDIIKLTLIELYNSGITDDENRIEIWQDVSVILKKFPIQHSKRFVRFRILDKNGIYPNCDLSRAGINFSKINQIPTLQTINYYSSEYQYSNSSELSWITRKELQVATCILLAPVYGKPLLYFSDNNQVELNELNLKNVPQNLHGYFLLDLIQFQNRFKPLNSYQYTEKETIQDVAAYSFVDFKKNIGDFNRLIDNYSIRDHLLMRTSSFLLKASMLWANRTFGEEAVVNIFFALEGCLHLLQKKHGHNGTKLNRKLLRRIFIERIKQGESLYDFIEEGYYKRISLVHAEPDWGAEWSPFLMAEDFYDYRDICIRLLNYILIDKTYQ